MKLTFEQFVTTRTEVTDPTEIARIESDYGFNSEKQPDVYLMYEDGLIIEKYADEYQLIIGASDYYSGELEELEMKLYNFYLTEY